MRYCTPSPFLCRSSRPPSRAVGTVAIISASGERSRHGTGVSPVVVTPTGRRRRAKREFPLSHPPSGRDFPLSPVVRASRLVSVHSPASSAPTIVAPARAVSLSHLRRRHPPCCRHSRSCSFTCRQQLPPLPVVVGHPPKPRLMTISGFCAMD
ncbi:hypothetical protein L1049_027271 [Liquidambar formosana]|uniref:Uncharacterized protein n=1 Tax=Liquidambar formosana TaxID=63359 RepID=A0AAP0N544_LIQFO